MVAVKVVGVWLVAVIEVVVVVVGVACHSSVWSVALLILLVIDITLFASFIINFLLHDMVVVVVQQQQETCYGDLFHCGTMGTTIRMTRRSF